MRLALAVAVFVALVVLARHRSTKENILEDILKLFTRGGIAGGKAAARASPKLIAKSLTGYSVTKMADTMRLAKTKLGDFFKSLARSKGLQRADTLLDPNMAKTFDVNNYAGVAKQLAQLTEQTTAKLQKVKGSMSGDLADEAMDELRKIADDFVTDAIKIKGGAKKGIDPDMVGKIKKEMADSFGANGTKIMDDALSRQGLSKSGAPKDPYQKITWAVEGITIALTVVGILMVVLAVEEIIDDNVHGTDSDGDGTPDADESGMSTEKRLAIAGLAVGVILFFGCSMSMMLVMASQASE